MKKSSNLNLRKASVAKKDEFYTQLSDIERELKHYKKHFKNKTTDQADGIMSNSIEAYVNSDRYEKEIERIYKMYYPW